MEVLLPPRRDQDDRCDALSFVFGVWSLFWILLFGVWNLFRILDFDFRSSIFGARSSVLVLRLTRPLHLPIRGREVIIYNRMIFGAWCLVFDTRFSVLGSLFLCSLFPFPVSGTWYLAPAIKHFAPNSLHIYLFYLHLM